MQADAPLNRARIAEDVGYNRIKIMNGAQTIAAKRQRARHPPKAEVAVVKNVLAMVCTLRRAIGHYHLGYRRAIEDWPSFAALSITDGVKRQALASTEANTKIPILPSNVVTIDNKARPFGLIDFQRAGRLSEIRENS